MRILILLVAAAVGATGCGGSSDPLGGVEDGDGPGPIGAWELVGGEPPIEVPDGARVTLTVSQAAEGDRVSGTAACNGYGGGLTWDGLDSGPWSVSQVIVTEMACDSARMQAESAYLEALGAVDSWHRDGDTLALTGDDVTLTFELLPQVDPASLTGTTWEVDGYLTGTGADGAVSSGTAGLEAPTVRFDEDGTVTVTTACRTFTGEWTTSGDQVLLPSLSADDATDGACEPAAEEQERQVLEVLESSGFTARVEGQQLTLRRGEAGLTAHPTG